MSTIYTQILNNCADDLECIKQERMKILQRDKSILASKRPIFRNKTLRYGKEIRSEKSESTESSASSDLNETHQLHQLFSDPLFLRHYIKMIEDLWVFYDEADSDMEQLLQYAAVGNHIICVNSTNESIKLILRLPEGSIHCVPLERCSLSNRYKLLGMDKEFQTIEELLVHYMMTEKIYGTYLTLPYILLNSKPHELDTLVKFKEDFWKEAEHFTSIKRKISSVSLRRRPAQREVASYRNSLQSLLYSMETDGVFEDVFDKTVSSPVPSWIDPNDEKALIQRRNAIVDSLLQERDHPSLLLKRKNRMLLRKLGTTTDTRGTIKQQDIRYSQQMEQQNVSPILTNVNDVDIQDLDNLSNRGTVYCAPWGSTEELFKRLVSLSEQVEEKHETVKEESESDEDDSSVDEEFQDRLMPIVIPSATTSTEAMVECESTSKYYKTIKMSLAKLIASKGSLLNRTITEFIMCTQQSREKNPYKVMGYIRQFIDGMTNYLKSGVNSEWKPILETEMSKLPPHVTLNTKILYESILNRYILKPLQPYLTLLIEEEHTRQNTSQELINAMEKGQRMTAHELGLRANISPPSTADLLEIRYYLDKLCESYAPLKKMEYFIRAINVIYATIQDNQKNRYLLPSEIGADEMLPVLVYCLTRCCNHRILYHAEYCEALLHRKLLSGEAGYYMTTLLAAVYVIKSLCDERSNLPTSPQSNMVSDLTNCETNMSPVNNQLSGVDNQNSRLMLNILIKDERLGFSWNSLYPITSSMTVGELCMLIEQKYLFPSVTSSVDTSAGKSLNDAKNCGLFIESNSAEQQLQRLSETEILSDILCNTHLNKKTAQKYEETYNFVYRSMVP